MADGWADDQVEAAACAVRMEEWGIAPLLPTGDGGYAVRDSCGWWPVNDSTRQRAQVRVCMPSRLNGLNMGFCLLWDELGVCVTQRVDACVPCPCAMSVSKQSLTHSTTHHPPRLAHSTAIPQAWTSATVRRCRNGCRRGQRGWRGGGAQQRGGHRPPPQQPAGGLQPGAGSPPARARPLQSCRRLCAAPRCASLLPPAPAPATPAPLQHAQRAQAVAVACTCSRLLAPQAVAAGPKAVAAAYRL